MSYLAEHLEEWTDIDVAAYRLAVALGLMAPPQPDAGPFDFGGRKDLFWTDNPLGNLMFRTLEEMVTLGALDTHPNDEHLFRWNRDYQMPGGAMSNFGR